MKRLAILAIIGMFAVNARADFGVYEYSLYAGGGPQPNSEQVNNLVGADVEWWRYFRSERQWLSVGSSLMRVDSNSPLAEAVYIVSIYPELTLKLPQLIDEGELQFSVRALGPSWISGNTLGDRQQLHHFAFQARAEISYSFESWRLGLAFQHFSNANLFTSNDGWDFPAVFTISKSL